MKKRNSTIEASIAITVIFDLVNAKPIKEVIILVKADPAMIKNAIISGITPTKLSVGGFIHRIYANAKRQVTKLIANPTSEMIPYLFPFFILLFILLSNLFIQTKRNNAYYNII